MALLEHPRFRAAYDFLLLREEAGEDLDGLGHWWTQFQAADVAGREEMVKSIEGPVKRKSRKRRPKKRTTSSQNDSANIQDDSE